MFPTTIDITSQGSGSNSEFEGSVDGDLASTHPKCLARRTVKLYFNSGGTRTLIDVDWSSLNGAWGTTGKAASRPDSYTIKVNRKRVDRSLGHGHRHICGAARMNGSFIIFPPPP